MLGLYNVIRNFLKPRRYDEPQQTLSTKERAAIVGESKGFLTLGEEGRTIYVTGPVPSPPVVKSATMGGGRPRLRVSPGGKGLISRCAVPQVTDWMREEDAKRENPYETH